MKYGIVALTILVFTLGCQKSSPVRKKSADANFTQNTTLAPAEQPSPPMVRNQPNQNAPSSQSDKPASPKIENTSTAGLETAKLPTVAASTPAAPASTTPTPASDVKANGIGQLDFQPKREEPKEVKKIPLEKKDGALDQLIDEKKVAAESAARLNKKAEGAENKVELGRTSEEKALWQRLVDYAADHGEGAEARDGFYMSLKFETSPEKDADRTISQFSIIGGPDGKGHFAFTRVHVSWENWKNTTENRLVGDQYFFLLSRDGNIAQAWRYNYTRDKQDHMIDRPSVDLSAEDAQKKWNEVRQEWYKRLIEMEAKEKK